MGCATSAMSGVKWQESLFEVAAILGFLVGCGTNVECPFEVGPRVVIFGPSC